MRSIATMPMARNVDNYLSLLSLLKKVGNTKCMLSSSVNHQCANVSLEVCALDALVLL